MSKTSKIRDGLTIKVPTQNEGRTIGDSSVGTPQLQDLSVTEAKLSQAVQDKVFDVNKYQTKFLSANHTTNLADIPNLQFNNLVIGKRYRISGQISFTIDATDPNVSVGFRSAPSDGGSLYGISTANGDSTSSDPIHNVNTLFEAVSTSLYFYASSISGTSAIQGDGTTIRTAITLEELNDYTETTDFT